MSLVKAIVSWIGLNELRPLLDETFKIETLSVNDGMVVSFIEFSKELKPRSEIVIIAELVPEVCEKICSTADELVLLLITFVEEEFVATDLVLWDEIKEMSVDSDVEFESWYDELLIKDKAGNITVDSKLVLMFRAEVVYRVELASELSEEDWNNVDDAFPAYSLLLVMLCDWSTENVFVSSPNELNSKSEVVLKTVKLFVMSDKDWLKEAVDISCIEVEPKSYVLKTEKLFDEEDEKL